MIPGPVFSFELLTTARRGRYYVVRVSYAFVLMLVLWQMHLIWQSQYPTGLSHGEVREFAHWTFAVVSIIQECLVLALVPALTAGVIASEKQTRTLHYVLASTLTSPEIVLGKLLARMLHVVVFLGVGLPILSMLVMLGGVDPRLVLLGCAVPAAAAFFLGSLSVLVSCHARRVRDALFQVYALEFLWLFLPIFLNYFAPVGLPVINEALETLNAWLTASSPLALVWQGRGLLVMGGSLVLEALIWMVAIQLGAGCLFLALASWRLRPVFARQEGGVRSSGPGKLRTHEGWKFRSRPACGDYPMLWKERFTARSTLASRVVSILVGLMIAVSLGYALFTWGGPAYWENVESMGRSQSGASWSTHARRYEFQWILTATVPLLFLLALIGVTGAAAGSITSEHEADTWTSLTATDLSGPEVIMAKAVGALGGSWWVIGASTTLLVAGLVTGSLHPAGVIAGLVSVVVYCGFGVALGLWVSLHLKSTWRAQFLAIAALLLINLSWQALHGVLRPYSAIYWPGFMPVMLGKSLFGPDEVRRFIEGDPTFSTSFSSVDYGPRWAALMAAGSLLFYGSLTVLLAFRSLKVFEKAAGRARRSGLPKTITTGGPGAAVTATPSPLTVAST